MATRDRNGSSAAPSLALADGFMALKTFRVMSIIDSTFTTVIEVRYRTTTITHSITLGEMKFGTVAAT